ncbi:MAG: pyridoxal phosphate-dependent aminotransferase [Planctomycetota bacterium]
MEFKPIKYLRWTFTNWGNVKYDLADSSAVLTPAEIYEYMKITPFSAKHYRELHDEFKKIISNRYGIDMRNIYPCYGTSLGIYMVFASLFREGDEILLEIPNYEPLYRTSKLFTKNIKVIERNFEKKYEIDIEQVERRISENTRAIIISNLHNPTGIATSYEKLESLAKLAQDYGAYLICYEIFIEQTFDKEIKSAATCGKNVITISSFARTAGLKGMKVGWICANEDLIEKIRLIDDYLSVDISFPGLLTAVNVGKELDKLIKKGKERLLDNIKILEEWVNKNEKYVRWVKPDGGTMAFLKLLRGIDSSKLANILQEKFSTLVVPGDLYWAKGYIRVCFGIEKEILVNGLNNISDAFELYQKHFLD